MRRASPLALRAIPNCQMDGSVPEPPPSLPPSPPAPAPLPSSSLNGDPEAPPRDDRPRKSRLYCKKVYFVVYLNPYSMSFHFFKKIRDPYEVLKKYLVLQ